MTILNRAAARPLSLLTHSSKGLGLGFLQTQTQTLTPITEEEEEEKRWLGSMKSEADLVDALGLPPVVFSRHMLKKEATDEKTFPFRSMKDFLSWRGLEGRHACAERLITQMLTFPVTVGWALEELTVKLKLNEEESCSILIGGARAEGSLPLPLWRELALSPRTGPTPMVEMIGPEIEWPPSRNVKKNNKTKTARCTVMLGEKIVTLSWRREMLTREIVEGSSAGLAVFFNPGLGHPAMEGKWDEAFDAILKKGVPCLLTAHSHSDAARDRRWLERRHPTLNFVIDYRENPFRSRRRTRDPVDPTKFVQTNAFASIVHL